MDEFVVEHGSLHNGLSIDFRTGIITGVPQEGGERSLVVKGTNSKYGAKYGAVSRIRNNVFDKSGLGEYSNFVKNFNILHNI